MVCCGRDFLVVWTIVLGLRRRESELLYDRARSGRLRALYRGAPSVCGVRLFRGVGRARVFRRPRGAYTLRASRYSPRVSCYAPIRPPPHPRTPSQRASLRDAACAGLGAPEYARAERGTSSRFTATPSDRTPTGAR